jgi:fatty acid desaturase
MVERSENTPRSEDRAALEAGGLWAVGVVLAILWIVYFAIHEIRAGDFLPFLIVLTWIAAVIVGIHLGIARWRRRVRGEPARTP